ncbi:Mitogen-activated protein kinase kinase kinase 1 [Maublancomyces gigas]|uniref:Mitogen-activated protein kinase kinase kinase 1 n=1 Tax=Discina gigas TaxID=1032678 RepID=A0ABR3G7D9_9PEZI
MSSSTTPRSSPVDDSGQETSPLLAGYRQTVVASTASGTQHASSNTAVAKYNGTWNRGQIIGGGKFSEVFLSQEASSRQVRAVKEIMRGRSDWVDREIQCMIVLQNFSDLFVGIQCWYRYMDRTFIAMDYYPLGDLTRQVVTSGPFDEPVTRDIAEQILHAVFVLHKHNLVHRDIKPQANAYARLEYRGSCDMRGTAIFENDDGADMLGLRTKPALVGATGNGNVKIVKLLIAKLNYATVREWQRVLRLALDRALRGGHSEVVEILWRLVSDVYRASSEELNVLIARFGTPAFLDSVYMYLHGKTTLSETESAPGGFLPGMPASNLHIQSMLLAATHEGNTANIDTLLSRVFGTSSPSLSTSAKILLKAAEAGHLRIVEVISALLRSYSGPPTELDPTHSFPTALTIAAQNGHIDVVRFLLKEVVMPDIAALNGAAIKNHTAVFRLLVTALLQIYGFTAQQVIASIDSRAIPHCGVNLLAAHPDRASLSAALELHVGAAAPLGHLDVVEWLLENVPARGRDLSDAVSEGLVGAAERGHVDIVRCLSS